MGSTTMKNPSPWVFPPKKPVLLTVEVKTIEALAWWWGRKIRMSTIAAAPNTCHHTETLLTRASRWLEKMLIMAAMTRMPMKNRKMVSRLPECQLVEKKPRVRSRKVAQP